MNDEEIMKKFNETFSDKPVEIQQPEVVAPYKAMVNQNVAPTTLNIPTSTNNSIPPLNSDIGSQPVSEGDTNNQEVKENIMNVDNNNYNESADHPSNVNYNYVPTYESKKKKTVSIKIPSELKPVVIIVIVLFIVVMIIPTVYEFFTHLR